MISYIFCFFPNSQEYAPITYRSPSEFTLVMGSVYLNQATAYTLQYDVLEINVNSGFNITTLVNDVALFFINGYIPTNWPTVAAIPLNTYIEANGTVCSVSGWGATTYNVRIFVFFIWFFPKKIFHIFLTGLRIE